MRLMRVAVEATSVAPGGGLSFLRGAVQALVNHGGLEVDVFAHPSLAHEEFGPGARVVTTRHFRGSAHRLAWVQSEFPRRTAGYDAIFAPGNLAPLAAGAKTVLFVQNAHVVPQPLWQTEYRTPKRRLQRLMAYLSIRRAGRVLFISEALKDWARPYWSCNATEPGVAHPGVTPMVESPCASRAGRDVLVVGNLVPHKRVDRTLRAFALLTRSRVPVGRLRIAGGGASSRLLHFLQESTAREGIKEQVDFLGFLGADALSHEYAMGGCYLSTSALEAFPLPPLEALAAGMPAVVPDTAPFREVCGTAGLYFADDDEAIARRVGEALEETGQRCERRRKARARAAVFSWPAFAENLVSALTMVSRPPPSGSQRSTATFHCRDEREPVTTPLPGSHRGGTVAR